MESNNEQSLSLNLNSPQGKSAQRLDAIKELGELRADSTDSRWLAVSVVSKSGEIKSQQRTPTPTSPLSSRSWSLQQPLSPAGAPSEAGPKTLGKQ